MEDGFYHTSDWSSVRARVLERDGGRSVSRSGATGQFLTVDARERLIAKTSEEDRGFGTACWIWTARINNWGYGNFWLEGTNVPAHRASHSLFLGQIPEGYVVDHLCSQPDCVNPEHLEAVPEAENIRRGRSVAALNAAKTHCKYGHEFTSENTYLHNGNRHCRSCRAETERRLNATPEYRERHRKDVAARTKLYGGPRWSEARSKALERDGHSCSLYSILGGECSSILHVHHILPAKEGGEPYDLDNLVTVCARHHPRLESIARSLRLLEASDLPPCPHNHPYAEGRRRCEERRRRQLLERRVGRLARVAA